MRLLKFVLPSLALVASSLASLAAAQEGPCIGQYKGMPVIEGGRLQCKIEQTDENDKEVKVGGVTVLKINRLQYEISLDEAIRPSSVGFSNSENFQISLQPIAVTIKGKTNLSPFTSRFKLRMKIGLNWRSACDFEIAAVQMDLDDFELYEIDLLDRAIETALESILKATSKDFIEGQLADVIANYQYQNCSNGDNS